MDTNIKEDFDIEAAFARLEEINDKLAKPGTTLKESLALYNEGVVLAEKCKSCLDGVKKELKVLTP